MLRKEICIPSKKIGSIGHLNQHKLGSIIGSFQERKLAGTSEKDWITISKKNFSDSFRIEGVICRKLPRGGKKKEGNSVLTNLNAQNYRLSFENKNCGHLEKSRLYRPTYI